MATMLGSLLISLGLDSGQFKSGMSEAERQMVRTQKKFQRVGRAMTDMGGKLSLAVSAPLLGFAGLSFKTASDAAELQSAFDQTFGEMSGAMNAWAEATGDAMGRSTQELQRAANTFGIFFNQAAPTRKEAAEMSKTFSVLAQDLASFYNVSEGDALQKLRSGLSGEAEPLRDFGVFLNEAAVQAKALDMGLEPIGGKLTDQQKILARYQLILEATANAQGDVARTSDGTANQMRRAKAAFEEAQVALGSKLLPILTPVIEKIGKLIDRFAKLPEGMQSTILIGGALAAAFGPVLMGVGALVSGFGTLLPFLLKLGPAFAAVRVAALALMANPVILGFAAVATGIYLAWQNWDKIKAILSDLGAAVKAWWSENVAPALKAVQKFLTGEFSGAWEIAKDLVIKAITAIGGAGRAMGRAVMEGITALLANIANFGRRVLGDMVTIGRNIIEGLAAGIRAAPEAVWNALKHVVLGGINKVKAMLGIASPSRLFIEFGHFVTEGLAIGIEQGTPQVHAAMADMADSTETATVRIAKSFKDMADQTLSAIRGMADAINGGGFLEILDSAIRLFLQVASTGLFGKTLQARVNASVPEYAGGTPFHPGGLAVVGERGPELVNLPRGSQVFSNRESQSMVGGSTRVEIIPSPYFNTVVDGRIQGASPAIMQGGAQVASARLSRRQQRSVA